MRLLIRFTIITALGFVFLTGTRTGQAIVNACQSEQNHDAVARKVHAAEKLVRSDASALAERLDPGSIGRQVRESRAVNWVGDRLPRAEMDLETNVEVEFLGNAYRMAYDDQGLDLSHAPLARR